MPLRRSPPTAVPALHPNTTIPASTNSASKAYESDTASEKSGSGYVSVRHKRKREEDDHKELKIMISSLSDKVDQNFMELKQKNEELKESLQFISDKYDGILKTLHNFESERMEDKRAIRKLEEKIEILERKNTSTSFEIRNVPISLSNNRKYETNENLIEVVKGLSNTIKVDLTDHEIKDIYRIGTHKEGNKPIMVELNSVLKKDSIIQGVKNFNKNQQVNDKLNTRHLNKPGPVKPVFISEALTYKAKKIFYSARQFARENGYSYCWTSRGVVYVRKMEGEPPIRIDTESSLTKLISKV